MKRVLPLLFALCPVVHGAEAAAPAEDKSPLPLTEAITLALRDGEAAQIAAARLDQARAVERQAWSLVKPSATMSGSYGLNNASQRPWGGATSQGVSGNLTLDTTIFNARAFPAVKGAKASLEAQQYSSVELRRQLAFAAGDTFVAVAAAERIAAVAGRRVEVALELQRAAERRVKAGLAVKADITRAESDVADARLAEIQANRTVTVGRLSLANVLGQTHLERPLGAVGDPPGVSGDPVALTTAARARRGDVAAARLNLIVNARNIDQIDNGILPTVGIYTGVNDQESTANHPDPGWSAGLTARWAIYDGGLREAQSDQQAAVGRELAANLRTLERQVEREIRTALADLESAKQTVAQADARSRLAEAVANDTRARYANGLATATETADANQRAAEAAADRERRVLETLSAALQLRQAVGHWPLTDQEPTP